MSYQNLPSTWAPWMIDAIPEYLSDLSLRVREQTLIAYTNDTKQFMTWLTNKGIKRLSYFRQAHIMEYLGKCKQEGKAQGSLNRYFVSIRSLCTWLYKSGRIRANLSEGLTAPKRDRIMPRIPSKEQMVQMLNNCKETAGGVRIRAILELMYSSALRVSELCDLQLSDYKGDAVLIKCGKGGRTRTVPLTQEARESIDAYLGQIRGLRDGFLFESFRRTRMTRQSVSKLIEWQARKIGIDYVTAHTIRHACATHLLDEGADLRLIQEVLGHKSIASTERYTQMSSEKIREKFTQFHPRRKEK